MKHLLQPLRTTVVGGFLFLVPIVVLFQVLGKAMDFAHKFLDPLAARLPFESVVGLRTPMLLTVGVIVLVCFVAGFVARITFAQKFVNRLEMAVLSRVPGYESIKSKSEKVLGIEKQQVTFPVVLARFDDSWRIGFRVEELENGLVVVFVPDAPNPQVGAVHFMTADRVQPTDIPPAAVLSCLKLLGAGSGALLRGFPK